MEKLLFIVLVLFNFYNNIELAKSPRNEEFIPNKDFSIDFSPKLPTNETLDQDFKCNSESNLKELKYWKYFPTKISCNDWNYRKMNTSFNITIDGSVQDLPLNNVNTFSAHVNGQLILIQKGLITDGICANGKLEKLVFSNVDPNLCDGNGVTVQNSMYATIKITGGYCDAFCFGHVNVQFQPGIKTSKFLPRD